MDDYYKVLGCDQDATKQEIRQQYKKLALQMHPDKNRNETSDGSSNNFDLLNKAATILTDEKEKHKYDSSLLVKRNCNKIVNDEISFEELTYNQDDECHSYDCRCGGQFVLGPEIAEHLTSNQISSTLIDCNSCSLSVLVTR